MQKNVLIDERLSSYRSFFDRDWSKRMNRIVDGTPLDPLVFDLVVSWKGLGVNNEMPRLMVEMVSNFWKGVRSADAETTAMTVKGVGIRLARELATHLDPQQLQRLTETTDSLADEMRTFMPTLADDWNDAAVWDNFRTNTDLVMAVWNSQRLIFGGLYYAYEHFLLRAYQVAKADDAARVFTKGFETKLAAVFGAEVRDRCWTDPEVNVARLVRNALAHNGGRETPELKAAGHGICVEGGELQIMAPQSAALFAVLKQRIEFFVNRTLGTVFPKAA